MREIGAAGEGTIAENAVVYARAGGTSFWAATEEAAEEWLLLSAEAVRRDQAVAAWEIEGASLSQRGEVVELADENGVARVRVTAPRAYAARGRPVKARLRVTSSRIELWVDAEGEALLVDPEWKVAGAMHAGRAEHTATLLDGGQVLVAGGVSLMASSDPEEPCDEPPCKPPKTVLITLRAAEVVDPMTGKWTPVTSMNAARSGHTATLLDSGQVLVAGGTSEPSAEVFDPMTGGWTPVPMNTARSGHTATKLNSGQVLVAGGTSEPSAEVYDPATGAWRFVGSMMVPRSGHTATLLGSGQVLVAGGTSEPSAEVYDPTKRTWELHQQAMGAARKDHTATWLGGNRVLITGGKRFSLILASAELVELKELGAPCSEASDCQSGFCEDGVCCNALCRSADRCGVCSLAAGASVNGVCTPLIDPACSPYCKNILIGCPTSCESVHDCVPGYVCTLSRRCELPPPVQSQRDYSDCSLTPAALLRGRMEPTLLLLAALATLRRRSPRRPARRPA